MTDHFLRQRRNLYILNGILLFSFLAKVNISKLTIAGVSFDSFDSPEMVYTFLWVIWIYFLYRFVVYFIEDEKEEFVKLWVREVHRYTNAKLESIAKEKCQLEYSGNVTGYYSMKECGWKINFQEGQDHDTYGYQVQNRRVPISKWQMAMPLARGITRFCLVTPAVTNYILPMALSLSLFYFAGFSKWEGALLNAIN